ncbi:MAG: energy transducer TonB, partial [Chitinophagaceae bacterium]
METSKILTADFLDILFEGRNKEYGAYELRRTYNKRMTVSIVSMTAFIALLFGGYLLANNFADKNIKPEVNIGDVDLVAIKEPEPEPVEPPPVKPPEQKKIETTQYTPPKIVPDEMVKPEDMPPDVEKLEDTKISLVTQEGIK